MKRKILGLLAVVAMCFTLLPANSVKAATVLTENKTGSQDGYDYELWKDNGNTSMTLNGGGKFSCQWSNINNALFRIGKKFDATKTYQELGNISVDYECDYNPSGNSYLCVYGWTKSPLVEYYVVDSWGTWRPPGATSKGQITVDGGTYDVYETTRVNQPSIEGNTTFKQYWSVRTSKRTSGTISLSEHFKKWESMGLQMGKMYEAALTVEGYQSSGRANVYKNDITIGGPVKPDDPPIDPDDPEEQVITDVKTGSIDNFDYELWKDNGNTKMVLKGGGKFSCEWSNINNALFRIGKKFDATKTYQQLGNIKVDYGCEYNPNGNSYLCVYGWTKSPLIEYYVVDSWGTWRPPGATAIGQITVDGGTYDVYQTERINQPSIEGTSTFKQYWSVRTSKRTSGTISLSEHFKKWESMGLQMGKMYEAALTVEGYQSSGSANVYKNDITIGGDIDPDDPPIDPPIDPPVTSDVVDVTVDARESGNSINQIYEITAKTSAPVDLSKLTIKSYFTKADTKPMTCWVDCADINMNEAPWYKSFSAVSATVKSDSEGTYLEVKVNDGFNLAQGKGKVRLQLRLTNNDWSNVSGYKAGKTVVLYQ